jgi:DnaD/phage-associated family protein
MVWHEQPYINRRNWMMAHVKELDCTIDQVYLLMLIDYLNEFQIDINLQVLSEYTNLNQTEVDQLLNGCLQKGYVKVISRDGTIHFDISGVFNKHQKQPIHVDPSLFEIFEEAIKRPLSENEMTQLSGWSKKYPFNMIVHALKEALLQDKTHFAYINRILENLKAEGKTDFD